MSTLPKNYAAEVNAKFPEISSFKLKEAYIYFGEVYLTSEYEIDFEKIAEIEVFVLSVRVPSVL